MFSLSHALFYAYLRNYKTSALWYLLLDMVLMIELHKDSFSHHFQVISTARTCNCILIVLDAIKPITHKRLIEKELEGFGIR